MVQPLGVIFIYALYPLEFFLLSQLLSLLCDTGRNPYTCLGSLMTQRMLLLPPLFSSILVYPHPSTFLSHPLLSTSFFLPFQSSSTIPILFLPFTPLSLPSLSSSIFPPPSFCKAAHICITGWGCVPPPRQVKVSCRPSRTPDAASGPEWPVHSNCVQDNRYSPAEEVSFPFTSKWVELKAASKAFPCLHVASLASTAL